MRLRLLGLVFALVALVATTAAARADDDSMLPPGSSPDGGTAAVGDGGQPVSEPGDDDLDLKPAKRHFVDETPPPPKPECKVDNDCQLGSICTDGMCRRVQTRSTKENGHTYAVPFYIHYWKHTSSEDYDTKIAPFLFASQQTDKHEKSTRVWPIIFHKTYLENGKKIGTQAAVLPIFWWQKRKAHETGAVPLLLTGWNHDPTRDFTEVMAGGLVYYKHDRDDAMRVIFPLYWDKERKNGRFATLFPLFYFHREGPTSQTVFFPVYWAFKNEAKGTENLLLFPLFDYLRENHGRRSLVISLLGGYEHDADAHRDQLLLLDFYHRRDRDLDLDVLFPIFARWKNRQTGSSGVYAGPFVHVADTGGSTTTFFPIYWRAYDARTHAQTHVLLPIGGVQLRPGFVAAGVGPVFGWKRDAREDRGAGWGGGIAPLLFFGHNATSAHAALLPIFWWSHDAATGKQLTAVGPLFVRQNPPTHGVDVGILPLLWFGKEDQRAYAYIAPVFWYRKTPERTTGVLGPLYVSVGKRHEAHRDYDAGLAPIAFFHRSGDESSAVVLPLFYHVAKGPTESTTVVLPYAHARRGDTTTDAFFPLMFAQRSPTETTVGTLIGGWHKKDGHAVGVFGPYIYTGDDARHTSTHVFFPVAFSHRSPTSSLTAVFPLFWDTRTGTEHDTLFVPLFWHRRGGYTDVDVLFPLFVRAKNPHASTYAFGPGYYRKVKDGWTQGGVFGLFAFGQKREGDKVSRFVGGPALFYSRNDFTGQRRFLFGPLFDWRKPDGNTSGLFPIVFEARRGTSTYAVTPFYYHQADTATGLSLNVVGPLYWGTSGGQTHFGLAPIFFGQYGKGRSKTVIFPLLYYAKKTVGSTLITPLGGYSSSANGYKALIGPLYVRRDNLFRSEYLFPLIYHGVDQVTKATTTVAFPFYADHENKLDGTRIQGFTPLVWRYRSVEKTITVGLPLIFDSDIHGESRTSGFLPFFVRKRSEVTKSSWWTVPILFLYGRESHAEEKFHDFVFFPLVWRFGGTERSSTVVFPLFWNFKRGDDKTLVVFPVMAKWSRPDGDRLVVLNTYYRKGKGPREGSWTLNVIPFFDVGHPRKTDFEWNLLEGLVGYSRLGRNRTLKLFWFIPIPLQPVPASSLSWWSSTPPSARTEF